jgi:hypothetical protein
MQRVLAANFENLLFLLLVAVAVLFQFLVKAAGKIGKDQTKRTSRPQTPPPIPRAAPESDEDRIRKLLEALGQPPTSKPPPPVIPRTNIPPRPVAPVQPPMSPLSQLRREKRRKQETFREKSVPPPSVTRGERASPSTITGAPAFEIHEGRSPVESTATIKMPAQAYAGAAQAIAKREKTEIDLATLLASNHGLRNAMVLREILGPPRGLRAFDLV